MTTMMGNERPDPADAIGAWMETLPMTADISAAIIEKLAAVGVTQLQDLFSLSSKEELTEFLPGQEFLGKINTLWGYICNAATQVSHPQGQSFSWPCLEYVPSLLFGRRPSSPNTESLSGLQHAPPTSILSSPHLRQFTVVLCVYLVSKVWHGMVNGHLRQYFFRLFAIPQG